MMNQGITVVIEVPSTVEQQELWNLEEQLQQISGVETNLQETKDILASSVLILHFVASVALPITTIGEGIKSIHDVAVLIYAFLHKKGKEKVSEVGKKKMVFVKKNQKIEIYDLSIEDIEKLLREVSS